MMKKLFLCFLILCCCRFAISEVLLQQDFRVDPNLSSWTKLDTPDSGSVSVDATLGKGLKIKLDNATTYRLQGLMSNDSFSVPTGGYLLIDSYATNHAVANSDVNRPDHSAPVFLISAYDAGTDGFFPPWNNYIALKAKDAYNGDWVNWYASGLTGPNTIGDGTLTWGKFKHIIIKIDAAEINFYIEDDFYENLSSPVPVKTYNTSDFFNTYNLASLKLYILTKKTTSWYTGVTENLFDGVKIRSVSENEPINCAAALAEGYGLYGDVDGDCSVTVLDMQSVADEWLDCVGGINCSEPWVDFYGRSEYIASQAPDVVTIDGDLSEWPAFDYTPQTWKTSQWVAIDHNYYSVPTDVNNAFMCLMYDSDDDIIYGAVTVDDYQGVYGYTNWNGQDNIEIYIQGDPNNNDPVNPLGTWPNAQQIAVGLDDDLSTTWVQWGDGVPFGGHTDEVGAPDIVAKVTRDTSGGYDKMVYEFKITPYDNYGGIDGTTTVITDVVQGKKLGFDIVLSVKSDSPSNYGMLCPNLFTEKSGNVTRYGTLTCE